jgi:hypothetical protein
MGRRIAACAVLMALMVSLSACQCGKSSMSTAGGKAGSSGGSVCVPMPCTAHCDQTACYASEADRDMGRLKDNLPPGGCCCPVAHMPVNAPVSGDRPCPR